MLHVRHLSDSRKTKKFLKMFTVVTNLFLLFGINIYLNKLSRGRKVMQYIFTKITMLAMIFNCALILSWNLKLFSLLMHKRTIKLFISIVMDTSCVTLLWATCLRSRKRISKLIKKVITTGYSLNVFPSIVIKISVACIILTQIIFLLSVVYPHGKHTFNSTNKSISSREVSSSASYTLLAYYFVSKIFPSCFIALYITLCVHFKLILCTHAKKIFTNISKKNTSPWYISEYFKRYNSILTLLQNFESTMNFPAFLILFKEAQAFFFIIYSLKSTPQIPIFSFFILSHNLVCFVLLPIFAATVNEADIFVKNNNLNLLQKISAEELSALDMKFTLLNMNKESAFVLTAWRFFNFTRSFFLSALGSIITYALLMTDI